MEKNPLPLRMPGYGFHFSCLTNNGLYIHDDYGFFIRNVMEKNFKVVPAHFSMNKHVFYSYIWAVGNGSC